MNILVTGDVGFIGSYLSRELLKRGDRVVGVDNYHDYYDRRAKEYNLKKNKEIKGDYKHYEGDVRDRDFLRKVFGENQIEKIVHLAAMAGVTPSIKNPQLYVDVNLIGTTNLLDLAVENNIQNFVFASSSSVYGSRKEVPFKEDDYVDNPVSPYAATKRMGEILLSTYNHLHKIPVSCLRFFTVYGPLQRPYGMVIQRFIKQIDHNQPVSIYGDGSMGRDFTYIDDIVCGIILALDKNYKFEIFNLGNSYPVTVAKLVDALEEISDKKVKRDFVECPPTEAPITYADISKAKKMLGYSPKTNFKEGLEIQYEKYQEMPRWYKDLPW